MKLWGKVMSGFLLIMAALFATVAVMAPEARPLLVVTAVLLVGAALLRIPTLVKVFISFTSDEQVLANGAAASATITSLKSSGWRYNRYYPIVRIGLSVGRCGAVYPVEIKQAIEPELFGKLTPGVIVGVRVDQSDRKKVVIDMREPIGGAG